VDREIGGTLGRDPLDGRAIPGWARGATGWGRARFLYWARQRIREISINPALLIGLAEATQRHRALNLLVVAAGSAARRLGRAKNGLAPRRLRDAASIAP